jgi:hypothetical protein
VIALVVAAVALAAPFPSKTSQEPLPERAIDADAALPKGWWELTAALSVKHSWAYRDAWGTRIPFEYGGTFRTSHLDLGLALGWSRTTTAYVLAPLVQHRLVTGDGWIVQTTAPGDARVGLVVQPWRGARGSAAFQLDLKLPTGLEWPGDFQGGPDLVQGFLTGTGVPNVGLHARGRLRVAGRAALDGSIGYVVKVPAIVGYLVEEGGWGNGWLDPGDAVEARLAATAQITPRVAATASTWFSWRSTTLAGSAGPSTTRLSTYLVPGTAGAWLDADVGVRWDPTPRWTVALAVAESLLGADTRFFDHLGLEELSPLPGPRVTIAVSRRL